MRQALQYLIHHVPLVVAETPYHRHHPDLTGTQGSPVPLERGSGVPLEEGVVVQVVVPDVVPHLSVFIDVVSRARILAPETAVLDVPGRCIGVVAVNYVVSRIVEGVVAEVAAPEVPVHPLEEPQVRVGVRCRVPDVVDGDEPPVVVPYYRLLGHVQLVAAPLGLHLRDYYALQLAVGHCVDRDVLSADVGEVEVARGVAVAIVAILPRPSWRGVPYRHLGASVGVDVVGEVVPGPAGVIVGRHGGRVVALRVGEHDGRDLTRLDLLYGERVVGSRWD